MSRTKGDRTKLVAAKTKSDSLRTTVPSFIVKAMELDEGDSLSWKIESIPDHLISIKVIKDETSAVDDAFEVRRG